MALSAYLQNLQASLAVTQPGTSLTVPSTEESLSQSQEGGAAAKAIYVQLLGRRRKVIVEGRKRFVMIKGKKVGIAKAREMEKKRC